MTCHCGAHFCYKCGSKWGSCKCEVISATHVLRHNRVQTNEPAIVCPDCRQAFDSQAELRVHVNVCRTRLERLGGAYECSSCLARFKSTENLRAHLRTCRAAKNGIFACPECHFECNDQATLRKHRRMCGDTVVVAGC